mgnify:CR=1 FL=1|jgi:hypothetical protein
MLNGSSVYLCAHNRRGFSTGTCVWVREPLTVSVSSLLVTVSAPGNGMGRSCPSRQSGVLVDKACSERSAPRGGVMGETRIS